MLATRWVILQILLKIQNSKRSQSIHGERPRRSLSCCPLWEKIIWECKGKIVITFAYCCKLKMNSMWIWEVNHSFQNLLEFSSRKMIKYLFFLKWRLTNFIVTLFWEKFRESNVLNEYMNESNLLKNWFDEKNCILIILADCFSEFLPCYFQKFRESNSY